MHASATPLRQALPKIANILYATDFSPCSRTALPYACTLASRHRATLHMINVVGPHPLVGPLGTHYAEVEDEDERARRELALIAEAPMVKALRRECTVHRGNVPDVVCRVADERGIDLIVMATHGRRGVRQFVLGSVAEQVVRHAHCAVLTIGPGASKQGPAGGRFARMLVALDLSPASLAVLDYARTMALANESRLVIFHAVQDNPELTFGYPDYVDDAVVNARKRITELMPEDLPEADIAIQIGSPAELILRTATDRESDLIVIGARRGPKLASRVPWAVAHEVVCAAPCPVLTVPHQQ